MSTTRPDIGPASVYFGTTNLSIDVPAFNAVTLTASVITPTRTDKNSGRTRLAGDYKVAIAPVCKDVANGGYTIQRSTAFSSTLSPTSGQHIKLSCTLPTDADKAVAMAAFLQKDTADPFLAGFYHVPRDGSDFLASLGFEPPLDGIQKPAATIIAATADDDLGPRSGKGSDLNKIKTTTGGVRRRLRRDKVPYRPDNTINSELPVTSAEEIVTRAYVTSLRHLATLQGADYTEFTDGSNTIYQAETNFYTALPQFDGLNMVRLILPPHQDGSQEVITLLGNLTISTADIEILHGKDDAATADVVYSPTGVDGILAPLATGMIFRKV